MTTAPNPAEDHANRLQAAMSLAMTARGITLQMALAVNLADALVSLQGRRRLATPTRVMIYTRQVKSR